MVKMTANYLGGLHCELVHGPSGKGLETDAPKDNQGKGESFSPTDLVGAALVSCILTTVAIFAERDGIKVDGASGEVQKEMVSDPRRIGALPIKLTIPKSVPVDYRKKLEAIAKACPVSKSLHPDIQIPIEFNYL